MPLADDTSGTSITPGEGTTPLFLDATASDTLPSILPDPDPGPVGLDVFDNTIWEDNNLGDDPRFVFRPRPGSTGAFVLDVSAWFVDQFWIFPRPVNFGNIFSDTTISVGILNAFRSIDHNLTSIDTAALAAVGVSITAGPSLPVALRVSEQIELDFTATLDGVPAFDIPVDFTFDPLP